MTSQSSYWDRVAHEKRFSHPLRLDWLEKYSDKQARILDYGCGYGRTLAELSDAGHENIFGMDFSEAMLGRTVTTMNGNTSAAFQYLGRKPIEVSTTTR